ncbi:hypothetical protein P3X46_025031 [Hevea brasiliensis]|uniref:Uncharacterized protein n=1 Tax=Hevea brasiliensis TaxID=3981 RepID=A0ABQ9L4A5_HEVBR|nr:hypothetical protein P3X46_025031 [Hevea brasiliensis]
MQENESSDGFNSALSQKIFEIELQGILTRKDSKIDLSPQADGRPLILRRKDDFNVLKHDKELRIREIATYGFYIAPIWFVTEVIALLLTVKHMESKASG